MRWQSQTVNMPADVMEMITVAMDHGHGKEREEKNVFVSLSLLSSVGSLTNTAIKETSGYQVLIVLLIYTYD